MEYKVTRKVDGDICDWEWFEAESREDALVLAIENGKEMCLDPYGEYSEEVAFNTVAEYVAAFRFEDFENGFKVYFNNEYVEAYTFEIEEEV